MFCVECSVLFVFVLYNVPLLIASSILSIVYLMMLNATRYSISVGSCRSVLLVGEIVVNKF